MFIDKWTLCAVSTHLYHQEKPSGPTALRPPPPPQLQRRERRLGGGDATLAADAHQIINRNCWLLLLCVCVCVSDPHDICWRCFVKIMNKQVVPHVPCKHPIPKCRTSLMNQIIVWVCRCAGAPSASAAHSLISWRNYVMMKLWGESCNDRETNPGIYDWYSLGNGHVWDLQRGYINFFLNGVFCPQSPF